MNAYIPWSYFLPSINIVLSIISVDNFMKIEYTICVRKVRNTLLLKGGLYMELAKVTSKGQVTIPIEIRKKLGIKNG